MNVDLYTLNNGSFTLTSFPAGLSKPEVDVSEDLSKFSLSEQSNDSTLTPLDKKLQGHL